MLVQKIDREYNYPLTQELARGQLQDEKIVAKYYTNDSLSRSIVHSHPFVEMIMPVSGGDMVYSINGAVYRLTVGDMVFIPKEIYHSAVLEDSAEVSDRLVVQLEAEIWNRALKRTGLCDPVWNRQVTVVDRDYAATWDIRGFFERMINTRHLKTEFQNAVLESQLVELQLLLEQTVTSRTTIAPSASSRVVASTVAYLQSHYTNPELNVGRLAQEAFVSREYLSRIFKETLINPPSAPAGKLFAGSALQKLEIHKVFLRFCALIRRKFARHPLSPDLISVSLRSTPCRASTAT